MIRLLIVDDQQLVRMGLRMLFEQPDDIDLVGEAANGQDAVRLAEHLTPDVVLMDLRMPGVDGITATRRITTARPGTRVLALTTFDDDDHLYPALAAGACGFLVKDTPPPQLLDGVRRAARGEAPFSQAALDRIVARALDTGATPPAQRAPAPPAGLTPREQQVLALLGQGLSNKEIGDRLHLGVTTVKTHVANLMAKTGCDNRIRLAVLAVRSGVTAPA
ncbi:response regulator [Streptomyces flavofungini]|uniref:Response regulator transcription factor n=1 Tax=Streptomyces flavofungini TaxID=68200 RepID=A0ABS0X8E1_9ACTN|nr:response regulator transcription factor [Streptomyces flavofungini]MBJ3809409.1 response regulator transcription factor [Streptomyces flavofungini]GHC78108.1 DNA-binding response regulator [Streptomyces flavofungini]